MGLAVAAAAAMLLAVAGAGLPPCSLDSRGSDGRLCAGTGSEARALRGEGALERARDAGSAGGRRRAKRGFTYPGTLWCGAGNIAEDYEQLGEHQETDRCCRDHDHCQHLIHPFTYKYGHRNLRWHTISHCDCDRRLKDCLSAVNKTASRVVGQAFFNLIQVPCFELVYQESCVESYLYVWCKNYSRTAVAVLKDPVMFDYGGELIDNPATQQPRQASSTTAPLTPRTHFRPVGNLPPPAPWTPSQARPSPLPPKLRKGKGKDRGRKGKGPKKRKGKKGPWDKAPAGEGAPQKQLAVQELGKGEAQAPHRAPEMGRGDSFNAVLSDEPGRGASEPDAAGLPESIQKVPQQGRPTGGPSGVRKRRKRRKRRRKLQEEEGSLPRPQKHSVDGRDAEGGGGQRKGIRAKPPPNVGRLKYRQSDRNGSDPSPKGAFPQRPFGLSGDSPPPPLKTFPFSSKKLPQFMGKASWMRRETFQWGGGESPESPKRSLGKSPLGTTARAGSGGRSWKGPWRSSSPTPCWSRRPDLLGWP